MNSIWIWVSFNLFVLVMLAVDLFVFHRKAHEPRMKDSIFWSIVWIVIALLFNLGVYFCRGKELALQFFTGYVIERALSIDNLFVFLLIFSYFKIPNKYQHKILFWGILGALVCRGVFIIFGVAVIQRFEWVMYILGAVLVISGYKLFFEEKKEIEPEKDLLLKIFKKFFPVTATRDEDKFFIRQNHRWYATPLFIALLVTETTDVVFAVDSVPAILAISRDAFIIYSSNVFAILGLRALYFVLAGMMEAFHYLHYALSFILIFIGFKMIAMHFVHIPIWATLAVITVALGASVVASVMFPKTHGEIPGVQK